MVLPLIGAGISTLYGFGKLYENAKFWDDYRRNTGYSPRYPFRAGVYDYSGSLAWGVGSFGKLKRL